MIRYDDLREIRGGKKEERKEASKQGRRREGRKAKKREGRSCLTNNTLELYISKLILSKN